MLFRSFLVMNASGLSGKMPLTIWAISFKHRALVPCWPDLHAGSGGWDVFGVSASNKALLVIHRWLGCNGLRSLDEVLDLSPTLDSRPKTPVVPHNSSVSLRIPLCGTGHKRMSWTPDWTSGDPTPM